MQTTWKPGGFDQPDNGISLTPEGREKGDSGLRFVGGFVEGFVDGSVGTFVDIHLR